MSKKEKNVFEKMTEALQNATNELETTNSYLYGIGTELADIADSLKSLTTLATKTLSKPISVSVDFEQYTKAVERQLPKPKEAEPPKTAFPEV
jgi:hypothetical protein